jgi:SPP1 family phage portal protein
MIKRTIYTLPKDTDPENGKVIADLIKLHKADIETFTILESYVDDEPNMQRESPNELLAIHNFAQYITDVNVGYLLGNPVDYKADDSTSLDVIADNYASQSISEIDSDLGEDLSMFGQAFENIFTDEEAVILSAKLSVYNTIVVYDTTFKHDKMFAVYYAPVLDSNGKAVTDKYDVTIWTKEKVLNRTLNKENLVEDTENPDQDHAFREVPVVHYMNNKRLKGDYEPVISLIDAYNILQSDRVIDREKLVDAILAFYGAKFTPEDQKAIKANRAVSMPEGSKAEYVIKQIDEADADVLRRTIAADIHKFSKTPDFTDDKFGNNPSGVSLKYKILSLEWNAQKKASQFAAGLKDRFRMYAAALMTASKITEIDTKSINIVFTRSLPRNDYETSQMINNLDGHVDSETLIGQLSFVEDASDVVKKASQERDSAIKQDDFGTKNFNKEV